MAARVCGAPCNMRRRRVGPGATLLSWWLLLAAVLAHATAKGSGGGGAGRAGGRASYGGGGTISRGYTRTYFFMYAGTRHSCSSCSRTTEKDSMKREMQVVAVLAEFDVTFEPGTELGTDDAPSAARIAAEEHVEARVAGMVARQVPTVTLDDVTVRDSWLAAPSCTGTASDGIATCDLSAATDGSADCPVGCNHENSTVMYEVTIFSGEAGPGDVSAEGVVRPTAAGAQVFDALRICGDCGTQGASAATANGGSTCAVEEQAIVAETRLADCCNTSVLGHISSFGMELTSSGAASGARISDCGNRTMVVMVLQSDVESFGKEDASGAGLIVIAVLFGVIVICCACRKIDDAKREAQARADRRARAAAITQRLQESAGHQVESASVSSLILSRAVSLRCLSHSLSPCLSHSQHLCVSRCLCQQAWLPSENARPHYLTPQPPVVMGEFVEHSPPTVAQALAKGQEMMGVPQQTASRTHNPVPRPAP